MRRQVLLLVAVIGLIAAGCGDDDKPAEASLRIVSGGGAIQGNVATLDLEATDIQIVKADGDTSGETGHFHVVVDKPAVEPGVAIPKAAGIVHSATEPVRVVGLTVGKHTLTVVLGDGTHKRIGKASATVDVTVNGPSVDASAPATMAPGQPLTIDVAVEGVQLVKADGDTSGKTGHLHVFVDKEPVMGQPIPAGDPAIIHSATAPIVVNGLTPGEHTIWVVLGDGIHTPFNPAVLDSVTVTVA